MDEKTIPLDKYFAESRILNRKPAKKWGEDLHYRALFEQTSECVFVIGMDFRYLAATQQALSVLGYQENELVGMPVSDVMSQEDALGHQSFIEDQSSLYERTLKRKNGSAPPVGAR